MKLQAPRQTSATCGFTLLELMVVMAIIATLSAIAYPSYKDHVRRGRLSEAAGELAEMRMRLEQFYQDARPNNYGSTAAVCGVAVPVTASFTYSCNWGGGGTSQSFLITATGKASADMSGYTYTIDNNNARRTTAFPGATGLPASCWLTRKGDVC